MRPVYRAQDPRLAAAHKVEASAVAGGEGQRELEEETKQETKRADGGDQDAEPAAKKAAKARVQDYGAWEKVAAFDPDSSAGEDARGEMKAPAALQRTRSHSRTAANATMSPDELKALWREAQVQYRGQIARKLKLQEIEKKIKEDRAREIQALRAQAQEEEARRKRQEDEAKDREERERNEARERERQERERLARTIDMDAQKQIMQDGDAGDDDDDDDDDDDMGGF
ncbi:Hypothetical Protein FCC1311_085172 [Hondaea fermentalgiana]|uniref:Uncharacterized protein n=1 Tax=Hondaea fermentalgiana TaxID=2315210 RepID=A0A2R5GN14_9STRA|nr:Hypothetical Protein FCC1311_085172 [Hondaea fermentalgiana]|eukprot:GBG32292.1 Hypothetical Protein FCC1311_085172 [Hondaea fermentalgiana]